MHKPEFISPADMMYALHRVPNFDHLHSFRDVISGCNPCHDTKVRLRSKRKRLAFKKARKMHRGK